MSSLDDVIAKIFETTTSISTRLDEVIARQDNMDTRQRDIVKKATSISSRLDEVVTRQDNIVETLSQIKLQQEWTKRALKKMGSETSKIGDLYEMAVRRERK